jgi:peptide/nickel transport system permease protein
MLAHDPTATAGVLLFVTLVALAILAPYVTPHVPTAQSPSRLAGPSAEHWLGTDNFGRDVLSRIVYGSRISLVTSLASIAIAGFLGSLVGLWAAELGGRFDRLVSRLADGVLAFPSVLIGTLVLVIFGPGAGNVIIALSIAFFPRFARLARGDALALRDAPFVEAARALGTSRVRIVTRHILPNVLSSIATMATLWAAAAIRIEATLSFLGLGAQPPTPSWGLMLRDGMDAILFAPGLAIFPGLAVFLTVLSLNMIGDGVRDALSIRG